ncbi:MAG TPA: F0F1 ATP synthase subunit epsilon [Acidobacteriota bacterium]|nr:F0F1 ATP synthase subunit epsilon [Acidobacteriota bacterium]
MAQAGKINLEIVTPEKLVFSGSVDALVVPAETGYMGILPGHAPLLAELGIGEISIQIGDSTEYIFCSWGFVEVLPDRVVLLTQTAELASDIDIKRAEEAKARAEKMLLSNDPATDYAKAEMALLKAISRIDAYKHRSTKRRDIRTV